MSRICDWCGRGPKSSFLKSHSHRRTKRWIIPNLQSKKINGQTVKICSNCLKTLTKKLAQ